MKIILHFVNRCLYCIQRNLYSTSTLSRPIEIYCPKKCLPPNTLPHIINIMNGNIVVQCRTSHPRKLHLAAERLNRIGVGSDHHEHQIRNHPDDSREKISDSGWAVRLAIENDKKIKDFIFEAVRLAIENGYLSWCRNTYLATVVGVAMQAEGLVAMSQHAAEGAFFIAGLNLMWGSGTFIANTILLRRHIQMSVLTMLFQVTATLLHWVLWVCIVFMYLNFIEEDEGVEVPEDSLSESSFKSV